MATNNDDEEEGSFVNGNNKNGFHLTPLELESEQDSLINETASDRASLFVRRRRTALRDDSANNEEEDGLFHSIFKKTYSFSWRQFAVLGILAVSVLLAATMGTWELESSDDYANVRDRSPPHQNHFGDTGNEPSFTDDELPKSNVGHAVHSYSAVNADNLIGHYWHNPRISPFAHELYKGASKEESQAFQEEYANKMGEIRQEFGQWNNPNFIPDQMTAPPYDHYDYRDVPISDFPAHSWQANLGYVQNFLEQAKGLVDRVKVAIFKEYGYDLGLADRDHYQSYNNTWDRHWGVRVDHFEINSNHQAVDPDTEEILPCIAFLNQNAWQGLAQKLLHAVMTQDEFYVVGVGPPSAYQGSNFVQTQMMQFHYLMEPVLRKLGVKLVTRHMAMDASTVVSSLAGASIIGEADVLWYLHDTSGQYWERPPAFDVLHKQAILSGERMPILLTPNPLVLMKETQGLAWVGNIQQGPANCGITKILPNNRKRYPLAGACADVNCYNPDQLPGTCQVYYSACWEDRKDVTPPTAQAPHVGHQWKYPNTNQHKLDGRKLSMLILRGLRKALHTWEHEIEETGNSLLREELWHVQQTYEDLRQSVRSLERQAGHAAAVPPCEHFLKDIDPMICHMSMRGATEWTPRVRPLQARLINHVVQDLASNRDGMEPVYEGIDLLPKDWKLPKEAYDAHMVALATNVSDLENGMNDMEDLIPDGDDAFVQEDDDAISKDDDDDDDRRQLSQSRYVDPDGWTLFDEPLGFCDGSAQSTCHRAPDNPCLLRNYNFYRAGILGHAHSGWLHMKFNIREGILLARMDWSTDFETGERVDMDSQLTTLPNDFRFEYEVDGMTHTKSKNEFLDWAVRLQTDLVVLPLYVNKTMSHTADYKEEADVKIRITSKRGIQCKVLLTHVYYA